MIEVYKIEEFVISQLFRPYMTHFVEMYTDNEFRQKQRQIEKSLRKNPELIIEMLNEIPEAKIRILNRLKYCGGVKWYRYLDMSNPVIVWVNKNLEELSDSK